MNTQFFQPRRRPVVVLAPTHAPTARMLAPPRVRVVRSVPFTRAVVFALAVLCAVGGVIVLRSPLVALPAETVIASGIAGLVILAAISVAVCILTQEGRL
jgi:hypothetical protein